MYIQRFMYKPCSVFVEDKQVIPVPNNKNTILFWGYNYNAYYLLKSLLHTSYSQMYKMQLAIN